MVDVRDKQYLVSNFKRVKLSAYESLVVEYRLVKLLGAIANPNACVCLHYHPRIRILYH